MKSEESISTQRAEEPGMEYLMSYNGQFIRGAESVADYHVYSFEHLDDLSFMRDANESMSVFQDTGQEIISTVKQRLTDSGWRGDGKLQIFWIPPFVTGENNTHGTYVFHVKQNINGTSWLASPCKLNFDQLNQAA